jgi:spore germination cell wall hydrolase CwlJ-like protein
MILTSAAAICLAQNIYFEARNQDIEGQRLVAEVTMTRVGDTRYPNTVCEVVWEEGQFSWTQDGKSDRPKDMVAWKLAQEIAADVLINGCDLCIGATHYATIDADPHWADGFDVVGIWGNHIFYGEMECDE